MKEHSNKITQRKAFGKVLKTVVDPNRPVLVHLVVTRRCNLSCGYCFEYDNFSKPVPIEELKNRIDVLNQLKTVCITLNGGEPLIHPQIVELVAYIAKLGMIPMMNSNGHILKKELIIELNKAGLFGMQISCDSLEDNEITRKSMKRLKPKLALLKEHAEFRVRINSVIGSGPPEEVLKLGEIVLGYGFDFQCSLMRDSEGKTIPLDEETRAVYQKIRKFKNRLPVLLNDNFQVALAEGRESKWKCRAGARHFEVDENGLIHFCQPRTGKPGKRLEDYTVEDIKRYFNMKKDCSKRCPVAYAHLASRMDQFRSQSYLKMKHNG